ncbi:MAG TPA: glycoside hydrolase family 3 N-terminal domain-containing protein [Candidatus Saccharimonadales bacterium]|nr:glycoside hydrolase family 3 N-terminal domain-containing protein [Candidatus Saccharimonadales bacterium]
MRNTLRIFLIFLAFAGVTMGAPPKETATTADEVATAAAANDASGSRWADKTLRKMSLEEKVGQLFMVWARVDFMNFGGPDYTRLRDEMRTYHLGSFGITSPMDGGLLMKGSPLDAAALTNQLQRDSDLPLLFAADFERGLPMRFHGGTVFPHAMAFGATGSTDYAYQFGRISAAEARAIGVHWNFYPDADVNSNPNNPIINARAFGEDPKEVSAMVKAFIDGVHNSHGMATAKHFPGHGDTDTDSHLAVSRINASRERLDQVELPPFRAAIAAGVDSVMVGHLAVPALDADPNHVATISYSMTSRLLKNDLGFQGIVITDAMDMNGVTRMFGGNTPQSAGRAAVEALKAGADYILIPGDLDGAYNGVLEAVKRGEIPERRIDESVSKILHAKAALGLHKNRFVDLTAVSNDVSRPENAALAQKIADEAVTVVRQSVAHQNGRQNRSVLPLPKGEAVSSQFAYHSGMAAGNRLLLLIFTDDARSENGRTLVREVRARVPDVRVIYIDDILAPLLASHVLEAAVNAERVVAAVYVTPSAGRTAGGDTGSPALAQGSSAILANVIKAAADKTAVLAMGSPYLIAQYPAIQNYVCTFSNVPVSEVSAVKFLFGEMPAHGHLPVTIPGIANRVPMPEPSISSVP